MSILLLPLGLVLLLAPSGPHVDGIPMSSIALAAAMACVGFALFVYANRGLGTELRIDSFNREIKIGTVNAKGDFSLRKTIAASETQSFFLMRAAPPKPARLCMRSKKGGQVVKVLNGSEAELVPILERISESLRPKHMAKKRVRTRVTGAFIHATFA